TRCCLCARALQALTGRYGAVRPRRREDESRRVEMARGPVVDHAVYQPVERVACRQDRVGEQILIAERKSLRVDGVPVRVLWRHGNDLLQAPRLAQGNI